MKKILFIIVLIAPLFLAAPAQASLLTREYTWDRQGLALTRTCVMDRSFGKKCREWIRLDAGRTIIQTRPHPTAGASITQFRRVLKTDRILHVGAWWTPRHAR